MVITPPFKKKMATKKERLYRRRRRRLIREFPELEKVIPKAYSPQELRFLLGGGYTKTSLNFSKEVINRFVLETTNLSYRVAYVIEKIINELIFTEGVEQVANVIIEYNNRHNLLEEFARAKWNYNEIIRQISSSLFNLLEFTAGHQKEIWDILEEEANYE